MIDLPVALAPPFSEELELQPGAVVEVGKATPTFDEWRGDPITGPFGTKAQIDRRGERLFAELAILRMLEESGWSGRWVQPYGAPKFQPHLLREWGNDGMPGDQATFPIEEPRAMELLERIAERNAGYGGCWDVFAWKGDQYLFAEAKLSGKDEIRATQLGWLSAALGCGLTEDNFLLVEWSF